MAALTSVTAVTQPPALPAGRRSRRPVVIVAGVVVMALAVGAAVVLAGQDGGRRVHAWDDGPLDGGSETITSLPVELGVPFTFGGTSFDNTSEATAVLEDVRVRPSLPEGIEIVGVGATGPDRQVATYGSHLSYPPPELAGALHPVPGTKVPPRTTKAGEAGIDVVFGLKVTKPGQFGFAQRPGRARVAGQRARRSSRRTLTVAPASLALALRTAALMGSLCVPSPKAMKALWKGWPSTVPRTLTRPWVPKNSAELGQTT